MKRWLATAITLTTPALFAQLTIHEFMASNDQTLVDDFGGSPDWIEIHNADPFPISLAGWRLSNSIGDTNGWAFPNLDIAANDYLVVYASGRDIKTNGVDALHTDFKLSANGEYLALLRPDGTFATEFTPEYPAQVTDISYGLNSGQMNFLSTPTPGAANSSGFQGFVNDTTFSIDRGFYTSPVNVEVTIDTPGATLVYTTDASEPTLTNGTQVTGTGTNYPVAMITVDATTVIRARGFKADFEPSNIDAQTYIFTDQVVNQPADPPGFPTTWDGVAADYQMDPDITTHPSYGPETAESLRALPVLSISTDNDNLFDATNGIYANPESKGIAWERAASVELFNPDNSKEFQVNCGLRIQGGYFRGRTRTQKHSFRLLFKKQYGPGRLEHDLFPDQPDAVESFDTIVLRAGANDGYSWNGAGTTVQWLRDNFGRDLMRDLGHPSPHGRFVHLYLNGLYWGMYNITERPNEDFSSDYFGGNSIDWDSNNAGEYKNGDSTAWSALTSAATAANSVTDYYAMQGRFTDGTRNLAIPVYLDADNYMDYMICNIWGGNWDWPNKNFWFGRLRTAESTGFKFYMWDFENTMGNSRGRSPLNMVSPRSTIENSWVGQPHNQLKDLPEYQIDFADRVHRAFFGNGILVPTNLITRYTALANVIEQAVVAESARWGDDHVNPPRNPDEWIAERDWLLGTYLPQRSGIVLEQFISANLYPNLGAPSYNQHGGIVPRGFDVVLSATQGIIYYTLDGNDPRMIGGALNTNATTYSTPIPVFQPVTIKARTLDNGTWSALSEARFVLSESPVRISEVMFAPKTLSSNEVAMGYARSDFEFIELENTSTQSVNITTLSLYGGIDYAFSQSSVTHLPAGGQVVILNNVDAFTARYGQTNNILIAGEFTGNLDNAGDTITLSEELKGVVQTFSYDTNRSWPLATQGAGHTLVPTRDEGLDHGPNWRSSTFIGGSPGLPNPMEINDIFVNEIKANTSNPTNDWIELYCPTPKALNNWFLSDNPDDLDKWAIPSMFATNHWLSFDQVTGFNNPPGSGFGFDRGGETVFLSHLPGNDQDRVADAFAFKAQLSTESWGRYPDGENFFHRLAPTRDRLNQLTTDRIVIHEVMYHPAPNDHHPADNTQDEYIVIQNIGEQPLSLNNAEGPWRIDGDVTYTFPMNQSIAAGAYLTLVSFNPSDTNALMRFTSLYAVSSNALNILGPFSGKLSNRSGRVAIEQPQGSNWAVVDELYYADDSPFPIEADGLGAALHRSSENSWQAGAPTLTNGIIGLAPIVRTEDATDINWNQATLHADLVSTGSASTILFVYYGTTDGGTMTNAWDHCLQFVPTGNRTNSLTVTDLPEDSTIHFRFRAVNAAGASFSNQSRSFESRRDPRPDYEHRAKITFSGYDKDEVLTNFPALVRLSPSLLNYNDFYSAEGADLLFLNDSRSALIPHEIEQWNTNGTSAIWVQVPELTQSNSCIWVYWGNSNATVSVPVEDINGLELWLDANAINQSDNTAVTLWGDLSSMGRNATETSTPPTYIENLINGYPAVRFDGNDDRLGFSNSGLSARTIFFVTRVNTGVKQLAGLIGKDNADKGIRRIGSTDWRNPGDGNDFTNPGGSTFCVNGNTGATIGENIWHIGAATRSTSSNTDYNSIGGYFSNREYGGDIAEVILYNRVLTPEEQDRIGSYLSKKYMIPTTYTGSINSPESASGSVWDDSHQMVWHLTDGAADSTSRNNEGIILDASAITNSAIADGYTFDGDDDAITGNTTLTAPSMTFSLWLNPTTFRTQVVADKFPMNNSDSGFRLSTESNGNIRLDVGNTNDFSSLISPGAYVPGTWTHIALAADPSETSLYINGIKQTQTITQRAIGDLSAPLIIGGAGAATVNDTQGAIDEVRTSFTRRSACWLFASYSNQVPGSTFTTFSPVLDALTDSDQDNLPDVWEIMFFGDLSPDGTADSDGDQLLDLEEWQSGTDPRDASSLLFVLPEFDPSAGELAAIHWPSEIGKRYILSQAATPTGPWNIIATDIAATPPTNSYPIDTQNASRNYYRVAISD